MGNVTVMCWSINQSIDHRLGLEMMMKLSKIVLFGIETISRMMMMMMMFRRSLIGEEREKKKEKRRECRCTPSFLSFPTSTSLKCQCRCQSGKKVNNKALIHSPNLIFNVLYIKVWGKWLHFFIVLIFSLAAKLSRDRWKFWSGDVPEHINVSGQVITGRSIIDLDWLENSGRIGTSRINEEMSINQSRREWFERRNDDRCA